MKQLWELLQNDPFYKDKTTLIVTNDHGRHTAGHLDGYISHGDACEGCRRIECLLLGPDIKKNHISTQAYGQTDIPHTIAELLGISLPKSQGKIMRDVLVR